MIINTVRFGEINIDDRRIFDFVLPIIGFNMLKKFIILEPNKDSLFKWLQSVEDPALAFPVVSVSALSFEYSIDLPDNVVEALQITNVETVLVMNITSIPQDDPKGTTINLLAPLVFNVANHRAAQVVLSGSGYEINYPMFKTVSV